MPLHPGPQYSAGADALHESRGTGVQALDAGRFGCPKSGKSREEEGVSRKAFHEKILTKSVSRKDSHEQGVSRKDSHEQGVSRKDSHDTSVLTKRFARHKCSHDKCFTTQVFSRTCGQSISTASCTSISIRPRDFGGSFFCSTARKGVRCEMIRAIMLEDVLYLLHGL